ncbi:MAG: 5-formyltetrahydrofolate cyclo-ligase [Pseudomonadota bacterium]
MTEAASSQPKKQLRHDMRAMRDALSQEQRDAAANDLAKVDIRKISIPDQSIIAGYYPIRSECNPLPLMAKLEQQGHKLALPKIIDENETLEFHSWLHASFVQKGKFSIPIPDDTAHKLTPDVVLLPLLACDNAGNRLGYGKGYYDRTLNILAQTRKIITIGLAFDCQKIEFVPNTHFDYALDFILTPRGIEKTTKR